jgi:galactose-1-phosphate uridylyltransferase
MENKPIITTLENPIVHVVYEPGDCTRYDFLLIEAKEFYIVVPYNSTFPFPTRLYTDTVIHFISKLEEKEENREEVLVELTEKYAVNPFTTLAVMKVIYHILKEKGEV